MTGLHCCIVCYHQLAHPVKHEGVQGVALQHGCKALALGDEAVHMDDMHDSALYSAWGCLQLDGLQQQHFRTDLQLL